jgi:hypothetical protein
MIVAGEKRDRGRDFERGALGWVSKRHNHRYSRAKSQAVRADIDFRSRIVTSEWWGKGH